MRIAGCYGILKEFYNCFPQVLEVSKCPTAPNAKMTSRQNNFKTSNCRIKKNCSSVSDFSIDALATLSLVG